ncbi:MAG: hypothetical protein AVDCRST_MAG85-2641, partial [uncultured Solirubrobacteraceae bacterium]
APHDPHDPHREAADVGHEPERPPLHHRPAPAEVRPPPPAARL